MVHGKAGVQIRFRDVEDCRGPDWRRTRDHLACRAVPARLGRRSLKRPSIEFFRWIEVAQMFLPFPRAVRRHASAANKGQ